MASLPKLDMGTVRDKGEKEKKTLKESMRKLSRKASASLKRGLTPRGTRHERKDSFDSLEEAAAHEDALAGALGPQESQVSTSESESHSYTQPPLVDAPRPEHERLPQFEPAESAFAAAKQVESPRPEHERLPQFEPAESAFTMAKDEPVELSKEQVPEPVLGDSKLATPQTVKAASADASDLRRPSAGKPPMPRSASGSGVNVRMTPASPSALGQSAAARKDADNLLQTSSAPVVAVDLLPVSKEQTSNGTAQEKGKGSANDESAKLGGNGGDEGDAAPHAEAPPADRPDLPQFEDASDDAALNAASAWEPVPAAAAAAEPKEGAQEEAAVMVADPASPARAGRPKWQEIGLAVSIFALGIIASEPALEAWRKRRQPPPPPVVDAKAAKRRGGWGFS